MKTKSILGLLATVAGCVVVAAPASAALPVVKPVRWVASNPLIPHDTYATKSIRLKATTDSQGANFQYTWDFGDGSPVVTGTVTNKYVLEASHVYAGATGTVFTARITVKNTTTGETTTKPYYVALRAKALPVEANIAIDEGLWYLHKDMRRFTSGLDKGDWMGGQAGGWASSGYFACTFTNLNAFEVNGHLEGGDPENPYVDNVARGMRRLFELITPISLPVNPGGHSLAQAAGANPDSSVPTNGIGIQVNQSYPWYQGGMVMDTLVASGTPDAIAPTGPANVTGRKYFDIVQDMVDAYAYAQYDYNPQGGGWRYNANEGPDNSACQWAAVGILAGERQWGCVVPGWLKTWNLVWLNYSKGSGGWFGTFGYAGPNSFATRQWATTPSGLVQLAMDGVGRGNPLWDNAETHLRDYFGNTGNASQSIKGNYYGLFSFTKAMLLHDSNGNGIPDDGMGTEPGHITFLRSATAGVAPLDWYSAEVSKGDPTDGVARTLVNGQTGSGYWDGHYDISGEQGRLETAQAIIMLSRTVFDTGNPVASASANPNPAVAGQVVVLDGTASFHQDAARTIISYEWDLNNDGTFETSGPFATVSFAAVGNYPVSLRVTDDGVPAKSDGDQIMVVVDTPPLAPTASAGGPYSFCPGPKWFLDGSKSKNPDAGQSEPGKPGDTMTYAWDLDGDGQFDDATGATPDVTALIGGLGVGSHLIQLRVTDTTATSFPSSGLGNLSDTDSTVVEVRSATDPACNCIRDLVGRAKPGKVDLLWTHSGADHYNVYRGTVTGGPYLKIGSTTSTYSTYLDSTVTNGLTYYYVVRGADALDREKCQSNEASVKPVATRR